MLASLQSTNADPVLISGPMDAERRQWVHLSPVGKIVTRDGRGPYRVDDAEAVIRISFQSANVDKLPIDYNHAIDLAAPRGGGSPAAGWISRMEARADGIWGHVEWTPSAAKAISEKEYRFLSPVLLHTPEGRVEAIARASLTNNPNLTLTALNAAQKGASMETDELLRAMRTALGLEDGADGAAILASVNKLLESRNSADPALFVPIATFQQTVAELNRVRSGVSLQAAERVADEAIREGRLMPFARDWAVSLCQINVAAFQDFLDGAGKPLQTFITGLKTPELVGEPPRGGSLHSAQSEVAKNLGHSAEDMKKYGGDNAYDR